MSDDLAKILKSIANTQSGIIKRLDELERRETASRGSADWGTPATSYFLCRPTDPPSNCIQHERGFQWWYQSNVSTQEVEAILPWGLPQNLNYPVGDAVDAFVNPYYYRWGICGFDLYLSGTYWLYENPEEFSQSDAAISDFWGQITWATFILFDQVPYLQGDWLVPLAAILFRNNGTTVGTGQVKPITLSDRQNSSFVTRDLRGWFISANLW